MVGQQFAETLQDTRRSLTPRAAGLLALSSRPLAKQETRSFSFKLKVGYEEPTCMNLGFRLCTSCDEMQSPFVRSSSPLDFLATREGTQAARVAYRGGCAFSLELYSYYELGHVSLSFDMLHLLRTRKALPMIWVKWRFRRTGKGEEIIPI